MASNHPNGASAGSGSHQNPFQPENSTSMNSSAQHNWYQQLYALAGALSNGNVPPTIGTTNSRTPQENAVLSPAILNQLLNINANLDSSSMRNVHSPVTSEPSEGNNISGLFLNPQLLLPKTELQRQNSISSVLSNSNTGAVPFNLLPFLLEKQGTAFNQQSSLGLDETTTSRNDQSVDPNLLKLQKLLSALPGASSINQNNLNSNNAVAAVAAAPSFPNQVAMMQLLTSAIQQQAQINRGANSVPVTVNFQRPLSPSYGLSPQCQGPTISSSTAKMGSVSMSDTALKQQGSWLSSASGDMTSSPDIVDGSVSTIQNISHPPNNSFPKSRAPTQTQSHVVDGVSKPTTTSNSHSTKSASVAAPSQNVLAQMQSWSVAQLGMLLVIYLERYFSQRF